MSTDFMSKVELGMRKARHLEICADPDRYAVEGQIASGFEGVRFLHNALPEISYEELDPSVSFLGCPVSFPFFISCMTGGSEGGYQANKALAEAAQIAKVPVGMGSIRILFRDAGVFKHFHLKPLAPDVPVLANMGSVQVRDTEHRVICDWVKRLEVEALVVHLNPGQELFQQKGDRDFRGLMDALLRLCDVSPVPIIVKETGFGIRPSQIEYLLDRGVAYVDLAGAGGTNWIAVESYFLSDEDHKIAREFDGWGFPTAVLLDALGGRGGRILASGGIRTGLDVAKATAMGASLTGMALPLCRAVLSGGVEAVLDCIGQIEKAFKVVMMLTGAKDCTTLRKAPLWRDPSFARWVASLKAADREP